MTSPELQRAFAEDVVFLRYAGVRVVVVHGGGHAGQVGDVVTVAPGDPVGPGPVDAGPDTGTEVGSETGADTERAVHVVKHLDGYLSANQLGITFSSLALGFLGEPFVKAMVSPILAHTAMPEVGIYWVSLIIAYASFTFLHVVVGELVPKSIAIRRSLGTTMMLVGPLHLFYKAFYLLLSVCHC
jgi:hypothetical protein